MPEQIEQVVQINDPIINNLVNTENKLTELNQELGSILDDYQAINTSNVSFFNFDNPFFLLTLMGLFMLVFALWFLRHELKYTEVKNKNTPTVLRTSPPKLRGEREGVKINKKEAKTKIIKKSTPFKGRKIKVVKIK